MTIRSIRKVARHKMTYANRACSIPPKSFTGEKYLFFGAYFIRENNLTLYKQINYVQPYLCCTFPNHTRHEWARWDAYISTADPDALYEEYRSKGVVFHQPLRVDGDGLLGFELADSDGYILFFGAPK